MQQAYNILVNLSGIVLKTASVFSKKLQEFTKGRIGLFERLKKNIDPTASYIWVHAASLGEFEMAVPVLKLLKEIYPDHNIVVSFFSPYLHKGNGP